jgi:hypothetical protein
MPPDEITAILATDELEMVRRYLELHRERWRNVWPIGSANSTPSRRSWLA